MLQGVAQKLQVKLWINLENIPTLILRGIGKDYKIKIFPVNLLIVIILEIDIRHVYESKKDKQADDMCHVQTESGVGYDNREYDEESNNINLSR